MTNKVQECSRLAREIVSNLFDAESAAERYRGSQSKSLARDFVGLLYKVEDDSTKLFDLLRECGGVFSDGYTSAVELWPPAMESAIAAVHHLGGWVTRNAAFAVAKEARPDLYEAPGEYPLPQLFREQDMLAHVEAAIQGFYLEWPGLDALNRASAMVRQETARALKSLEKRTTGNETDNEKELPPLVSHSEDYRSVLWFGEQHTFTPNQAACVKILWEHWEQGTPDVGNATILDTADVSGNRLDLVFRGRKGYHTAWGTMIVEGKTKGTHRLYPAE